METLDRQRFGSTLQEAATESDRQWFKFKGKQQRRWHGFSGSKGIGLMVVCDNGGGSVVTVGWLIILPRGVGWGIMGYKPKRLPSYIELRKFSYSIILS